MRLTALRVSAVAVLVLLIAAPAPAQAPRPMTLVDLINVPRVLDPQLSPDGRQVAFVRSEADWQANRRIEHIWRIDIDGSNGTQLTHGSDGENSPRWSPDGRALALIARRGESASQLYLLPTDGGEARPLTKHDTAVSNPTWAPDGSAIYFLAADPKSAGQQARERLQDDTYAYDEDYQQRHLWKVVVASGETVRITSGDFSILAYDISRDGRRMTYHRAPNPLFGWADRGEVWVSDVEGGNAVRLTDNTVVETGARLSPDASQVLFLSTSNGRFEPYYNRRLFLVPARGGPARSIEVTLPYEVLSADWSRDGTSIYAVVNTGVESQLARIDPAGADIELLTQGRHSVQGWTYAPAADRHVFLVDEPVRYGDIWTLEASNGGSVARVTSIYDHLTRDFRLPRQEAIAWTGQDGVQVEGLLYYPLDYQEGTRFPLVVQTHGGPASSDRFGFGGWIHYVQVLTAHGYFVLKPNYRGSTGYGDAFLRDMVGGYFRQSHLDVIAGVDHVIDAGLVDVDRMAKMGWSAGGHMTNRVITFTDRFKAASSGAGAANWISMYAQSDVRTYRTPWFGGTPWQENAPIDLYLEHSPIMHVARVTTPTIFIVGERDVRVPLPQSVEMFRGLQSNGVPTHLYVAPREGHGFQELRHQLFKMNVELEWFERHVTRRPYTREAAPGDDAAETVDETTASRLLEPATRAGRTRLEYIHP